MGYEGWFEQKEPVPNASEGREELSKIIVLETPGRYKHFYGLVRFTVGSKDLVGIDAPLFSNEGTHGLVFEVYITLGSAVDAPDAFKLAAEILCIVTETAHLRDAIGVLFAMGVNEGWPNRAANPFKEDEVGMHGIVAACRALIG